MVIASFITTRKIDCEYRADIRRIHSDASSSTWVQNLKPENCDFLSFDFENKEKQKQMFGFENTFWYFVCLIDVGLRRLLKSARCCKYSLSCFKALTFITNWTGLTNVLVFVKNIDCVLSTLNTAFHCVAQLLTDVELLLHQIQLRLCPHVSEFCQQCVEKTIFQDWWKHKSLRNSMFILLPCWECVLESHTSKSVA